MNKIEKEISEVLADCHDVPEEICHAYICCCECNAMRIYEKVVKKYVSETPKE